MSQVIFDYRIVEVETENGSLFMPQRGVNGHIDGLSSTTYWRDAVPTPAPSRELADLYVKSLQIFDQSQTQGKVVWESQ